MGGIIRMKTLLITLIITLVTSAAPVQKIKTTPTGTLITYEDGTGFYIGK